MTHPPHCSKPWFLEWFDETYLRLYQHRDSTDAMQHVELILRTLSQLSFSKSGTILDLACGGARYTSIFKNMGYRILGLDLSETLVNFGKKNDPQLNIVVGDMRHIPGMFDLILSLFTSFGYFEEDEENEKVIHAVSNALNDNGIFWMDFLNPSYLAQHLVPESRSCFSDDCDVIEKRRIENQRVKKDILFIDKNNQCCTKTVHESVRLYTRENLESYFKKYHLQLICSFGDYTGNPWTPDSKRTILVGRKTISQGTEAIRR